MIVSIHQPNHFPAYQYFDKIKHSDVFVLLDGVMFQKNGWQNRNRIETKNSVQWLTVPIKHSFGQLIKDVEISGNKWIKKHINTIEQTFKCRNKAEWKGIKRIIEKDYKLLSDLNCKLIKFISKNIFGFNTFFINSSEFEIDTKDPDDRIIQIVERLNGNVYIAGKGGKNYMDLDKYKGRFEVKFQKYTEEEPILSVLHKVLK